MTPPQIIAPPPAIGAEKPTTYRYGVLGFACVLSMITYLDRVCFGTVAPYVQSEFGLTETQKGWLFTAFAFAYAIFEVPTGWLGDRFGARKTLIRIVLWWSVFTALTPSIYSWSLSACRRCISCIALAYTEKKSGTPSCRRGSRPRWRGRH